MTDNKGGDAVSLFNIPEEYRDNPEIKAIVEKKTEEYNNAKGFGAGLLQVTAEQEREEIIKQTYEQGITKFVCAGYNVKSSREAIDLANKYNFIYSICYIFFFKVIIKFINIFILIIYSYFFFHFILLFFKHFF